MSENGKWIAGAVLTVVTFVLGSIAAIQNEIDHNQEQWISKVEARVISHENRVSEIESHVAHMSGIDERIVERVDWIDQHGSRASAIQTAELKELEAAVEHMEKIDREIMERLDHFNLHGSRASALHAASDAHN